MRYFDYCTGLTHDQRALRRAVRRPGAQARRAPDRVPHGLAASIQAVTEEVMLRLTRARAAETGAEQSVPGRRRRAQLRRQRQACCATGRSTASGFSRRPATPAARSARRWPPGISSHRARRASSPTAATACSGAYLGPRFAQRRNRAVRLTAAGASVYRADEGTI